MRIALSVSALLTAAIVFVSGCGPSSADAGADAEVARQSRMESPAEAVESMLALAREGEWAAYIERYYGEQHKLRGPDDRDALAAMLASRADQIISALEQVQDITPDIAPGGTTATFSLPRGGEFTLHRDSGGWTFHL